MKFLVFRLSSLGDILLATAFLETLPEDAKVDWVVRSEFAFALAGHPKIENLIAFERKTGLNGWIALIRKLSETRYTARVDLHRNLRSTLALLLFRVFDLVQLRITPHQRVSKERVRSALYFIFKSLTPLKFRPTRYWIRFARLAVRWSPEASLAPPSFWPILDAAKLQDIEVLKAFGLQSRQYYAVMPAASFRSKEWSPERYFSLLQTKHFHALTPVLLGRTSDPACLRLQELFVSHKIKYLSLLEEADFKKTALVLKHAKFYLGSDTGLAHLAEAVGTKSLVIYGPTRPDLGFGPWREESKSIFHPLACSPCSKDGKICIRFWSPYACLKELTVSEVEGKL